MATLPLTMASKDTSGSSMSSNATASASPTSSAQVQTVTSSHVTSATPTATSDTPTTSTSPTTSTAPTPTSQSSSAQASSTAAETTSSSPTSPTSSTSTPFTSTAAPTTSTSSSFTSQVATTLYSTDPAGSVVYYTTTVPEVVTTSVSTSTSSNNSSHTGVIVGSVVGGVAGIILLVLLLFCIRRRARKEEFDGNFDPDRVVGHTDGGATLPNVGLADEVAPFPQSYTDQGSSSMRQYGESSYLGVPSSLATSGQTSPELYASGAAGAGALSFDAQSQPFMQPGVGLPPSQRAYIPPINPYGTGSVDWHTPLPGASPPASTVSYNTTSTRAAKEREAMGRIGQGQGLTTQPEAAEGSGGVVVHQDAGRAPSEEHMSPKEIPPAYDSIRQD